MLDFFGKLQNQEYRLAIYAKDSFDRTHPLSSERIEALSQTLKSDPAWGKPTNPALEARFQRVKAKLLGYIDPKQAVIKYPEIGSEHTGSLRPCLCLPPRWVPRKIDCRSRRSARGRS